MDEMDKVGLMDREAVPKRGVGALLLHGDFEAGLARLELGSVDAIIMDPPYGTTALKWDQAPNLARMWAALDRVTRPESVIVSFCAQPFTTDLIVSNRKNFRYELIWEKGTAVGFLSANRRPLRAHENIVVFCKKPGASKYRPQFTAGRPYRSKSRGKAVHYGKVHDGGTRENTGTRHPRSVLKHNQPRPSLHPTQKPLELVEWLVRSFTDVGDLVVDPFMGSGTTIVAAVRAMRRAVGIEREEEYVLKAAARLSAEGDGDSDLKFEIREEG